jgi:hypothetical protein
VSRDDKTLPPWTGDPKRMQDWTNAKLNEIDAAFDRELAAGARARLKAHAPPDRTAKEERKRKLTIGKRALAKSREASETWALEEAETKNLEPLRKLHPQHARFINLPPLGNRGDHFKKAINHDPLAPHRRLEEAVFDLSRIRAIWREHYGRSNRPSGELTAEKIAAERWGLTEEDVRERRVSRKTLRRLARRGDV